MPGACGLDRVQLQKNHTWDLLPQPNVLAEEECSGLVALPGA